MSPPKIMIVEDESLVARDIQACLDELGFVTTAIASSASQAIAWAVRDEPDMIIMDVRLRGEEDGVYAATAICKDREVPIVFLTAFADREVVEQARNVGPCSFLVKPFVNRQLQAMVEIGLHSYRLDLERRRLDERIRQAEALSHLRELAGGVAHEFNNHLHSIIGNLVTALKKLPDDSPALEHLETVRKSAQSASDWSNQLLVWSGNAEIATEALDISEMISRGQYLVSAVVPADISIVYELSTDLPLVEADSDQIQQIVMILTDNASKAMTGQKGTLTIRTSVRYCDDTCMSGLSPGYKLSPGDYVVLAVEDTGRGMERLEAENLLDPFVFMKETVPGLGLAAVCGIARAHQGAILLVSSPGVGTTVKVLLPVSGVREVVPPVEAKGGQNLIPTGGILVADDDKMVLAVNKEMIEELGFIVFTAGDARQAMDVLRRNSTSIVCVLLDLTMPYVNGETIVEEFQSVCPGIKVVLTSGFNRNKAIARFGGDGLHGFIQKPFQILAMQNIIGDLFE